ncbi:MAG: DUF3108 domain-containing protein [Planctomycetota bacterium]|jgi:hypothetical protein|nr:DUF3108 domain-containing protein [Planctomycetota bacterium]
MAIGCRRAWNCGVVAFALALAAPGGNRLSALDFPRIFNHHALPEIAGDEMREEERISEALDRNADYRAYFQSVRNPEVRLQALVRPGEELIYQARWRGLPAGNLRLLAKRQTTLRGRRVFVFELDVESNDFLSAFYPVSNSMNSYVDAASGRSYLLRRRISERNRQYKDRLEFKYDSRLANGLPNPVSSYSLVDGLGRETVGRPIPISGDMQDVVSAIYYLRGLELRRPGDECAILLGGRRRPVLVRISVTGEERLEVPGLGAFDCLVIEPNAEGANLSGNPLATRGGEKVWLEKHCLVPIQVEAELPRPLGSVIATLAEVKNHDLQRHAVK